MSDKAGPARAAGKLAGGPARIVLAERTVRIETRNGTVRTKKGEPTPAVDLELGAGERLLDFVILKRGGPSFGELLASPALAAKWEKRKTTDWDWEATVVIDPAPPKPKSRRRRSTGNGAKG